VAFVYFSGYGLQLEGENYVVPVNTSIIRRSDVLSKAIRISDYTRALTTLQLKASFVILDGHAAILSQLLMNHSRVVSC
jgi:uncharacterized caspase-like protein